MSDSNVLKRFVTTIFTSKKIVIAFAAWLLIFLRPYFEKLGLEVTAEELQYAIGVGIALILGQGVADMGKGKAQFEAAQAAKGQTTSSSSLHVEVAAAAPSLPPPLPPAEES